MSWSKVSGWSWLAWAVAACSSPVAIGHVPDEAGSMNMAGSGGAAGSDGTADGGGEAGSGGTLGGAGGSGGVAGTPPIDAATDTATTSGSGGAADASTTDGSSGAAGQGGNAGVGGTSMSDGAAGSAGASGGRPDAGDGGPGTQPACAGLLTMVNRESWIAFDSDRDGLNRNLYMMHPDRSGLTQLTTGMNVDREPFFSYDGTKLSYTSVAAGKSQIFIMDLATLAAVQLTTRPEGADQATFSRDGKWVAFHSGPSVYIIKTDGSGERVVTTGLDELNADQWPAFSADGTELLFSRGAAVHTIKLDGTGLRYITGRSMFKVVRPAVSPSGVDVASPVICDPPWTMSSIWMSPIATSTEPCNGRRITPVDDFESAHPTWGTDFVLAYHRSDRTTNRGVIAMVSAVDSQPCFLTSGPEDSRNPSWSQPSTLRR